MRHGFFIASSLVFHVYLVQNYNDEEILHCFKCDMYSPNLVFIFLFFFFDYDKL